MNLLNNIIPSIKVFFYSLLNRDTKYPNYLIKFEEKIKKYFNSNFSLTFSNGTTAAASLIAASGIKEGSVVLISKISFPSIISILLYSRATIIFLDVDRDLQIKIPDEKILDKAEFSIITHAYGYPQKGDIIQAFKNRNIRIIEDFSHAQGAKIENKYAGTIDIGGFSSMQGEKAILFSVS